MDTESLLKRRKELFKPIDQQIMMTDDTNDLLLMGSNMIESAAKIFIAQYGVKGSKALIDGIFRNIVMSSDSSTE